MNNNQLCFQTHIPISTQLTLPEGYTHEDVKDAHSRYNTVFITMNDDKIFTYEETDLLCYDKLKGFAYKEHFHSSHYPSDELAIKFAETFTHTNK